MKIKTVRQVSLTGECWLVQVWGLNQCESCEAKNTSDCGGQQIRQTGKNGKGFSMPVQ